VTAIAADTPQNSDTFGIDNLSLSFLLLVASLYVPVTLGFYLDIPISTAHLPFGIAIYALILGVWQWRRPRALITSLLVPPLWLGLSAYLVGKFLDYSFDGAQYHQEAIFQLELGWNPFKEIIFPDIWDTSWAVWLNSLPKFGWTLGAILARGLNRLESAKFLTTFLVPAVFLSAFTCARRGFRLSRGWSVGAGLIAAANPIAASQLCVNYIDGYVTLFGSIALYSALEFLKTRTPTSELALALSLVFACLAKFTNLFLVVVLAPLLALGIFRKSGGRSALRFTAKFMALGIIATGILGLNPYLSNLYRYGSLNYPMSADKWIHADWVGRARKIDQGMEELIYTAHLPNNFAGKNRVYKFFYSLFGRSEHVSATFDSGAHLKLPFDIRYEEWSYLGVSDGRIAGLGPLFSVIFLFSIVILLLAARSEPMLPIFGGAILIAAVSNPYGWWGRYIGFFWGIGGLGLLALAINPKFNRRAKTWLGFALVAIALINSLPIVYEHLKYARHFTKGRKAQLADEMARRGYVVMDAYFGGLRGYLSEQQLPFLGKVYEESFVKNHLLPESSTALRECFREVYAYEEWRDPDFKKVPPMRANERVMWIKAIQNQPVDFKRVSAIFESRGEWGLKVPADERRRRACAQAFVENTRIPFRKAPLFESSR
jgi:hypothetical protein